MAGATVQLRFATPLTGDDYVTQQGWRNASLAGCPLHPRGGCGFARHGTYARVSPPGTRIARWYCPMGHCTFSLLPDCLAARLSGTLAAVEQVVVAVEQAPTVVAAADALRPDIELPGALRWTRRRVKAVHDALHRLKGLLPEPLAAYPPRVLAFRQALDHAVLWPAVREIAADYLSCLPPPLGLAPPSWPGGGTPGVSPQWPGPAPPGVCR